MLRWLVPRWAPPKNKKNIETVTTGQGRPGTGGTCAEIGSTFYIMNQFDAEMSKKLRTVDILSYDSWELVAVSGSTTERAVEDILDGFFKEYGL